MGVLDNLKSIFIDDFKAGAEQTSKLSIVHIDPNAFDKKYYDDNGGKVNPSDVQKMRDALDSQAPGMSKQFNDTEIKELVEASLTQGPFAGRIKNESKPDAGNVCIVNSIHSEIGHKDTLMPLIARTELEKLKEIPGWNDHWERLIGIHEGQHCNQADSSTSLDTLAKETEADQAALNWAKENNLNELAQAYAHYRALGAAPGTDLEHSTSIFLNTDGTNPDGLDKVKAAATFKEEMFFELSLRVDGMSFEDSKMAAEVYPVEFAAVMEEALNEGAFKRDNPYVEQFVRDYVEGIKNTGKPVDAEENITYAARNFDTEMMFEVMLTHDIDFAEATKMREDNPELFAKTIEDSLKSGAFDRKDNPYIKEYTQDYIEGFRKQVIETKPAPPHRHHKASVEPAADENAAQYAQAAPEAEAQQPTLASAAIAVPSAHANIDVAAITTEDPKVDLADDLGTSMKIGGVSAGAYFASFADPNLADDRATMALNAPVIAANSMENRAAAVSLATPS